MKYLEKSFSVGPPRKIFGCEACIYGSGQHTCGGFWVIDEARPFTEEDFKRWALGCTDEELNT